MPAQVLTEPLSAADDAELTVSVNFWFSPYDRMLEPAMPLTPMLRVELARQLEFLVVDALGDRPQLVHPFFIALTRFVALPVASHMADGHAAAEAWAVLRRSAPDGVAATDWSGLAEWVLAKAAHLLGPSHVRPFVLDALSPARFERLARGDDARAECEAGGAWVRGEVLSRHRLEKRE